MGDQCSALVGLRPDQGGTIFLIFLKFLLPFVTLFPDVTSEAGTFLVFGCRVARRREASRTRGLSLRGGVPSGGLGCSAHCERPDNPSHRHDTLRVDRLCLLVARRDALAGCRALRPGRRCHQSRHFATNARNSLLPPVARCSHWRRGGSKSEKPEPTSEKRGL